MGNSFLLIVVGLLIFYLVISNKWLCVEGALACMLGKTNSPTTTGAPTTPTSPAPTGLPQLIKPPTAQTLVSYSNILNGGFGI